MITPVVLSRAYPIGNIEVLEISRINPNTLSVKGLETVGRYTQIASGSGSWATGLSVVNAYNASVYLPPNIFLGDIGDLFFAGDIKDADAVLPGIRLEGGCTPYLASWTSSVLSNTSLFPMVCQKSLERFQDSGDLRFPPITVYGVDNITLTYAYCANSGGFSLPFVNDKTQSKSMAYVYINSTNHATVTTGFIKCHSTFSLGTATLLGRNRAFTDFKPTPFWNASHSQGGEPFMDPMAAVMYYLGTRSNSSEDEALIVRQLGYREALTGEEGLGFTQPSLKVIANQLWSGIAHMVAVTVQLATTSDTEYPATLHHVTAGRTRSYAYVIATLALLALWLSALIYLSINGYRMALSSSLDTYLAIRLCADEPHLMGEKFGSEANDNPLLQLPFVPKCIE